MDSGTLAQRTRAHPPKGGDTGSNPVCTTKVNIAR